MRPSELLTLEGVPGVGNKTLISLIEYCQLNGIDSLYQFKSDDISRAIKLKATSQKVEEFLSSQDLQNAIVENEARLSGWMAQSVSVVPFGSKDYPPQLSELHDPPALLFCRGNISLLKEYKSIAVVGTRQNTSLGEFIARKTAEFFTQRGFCIVSGLALGIDAIAHRATLDNQGQAVAVLVDVLNVAPAQNRSLAENILNSGGLLVSENAPDAEVVPALFAKRDRIQAGLSLAVFAIETGADGGTMHAIKAAEALKRPVYVPDPVAARYPDLTEPAIRGTQWLVEQSRAQKYSRDSYGQIVEDLESRASRLESGAGAPGRLL